MTEDERKKRRREISKRHADANREKVRAARRASYAKNPKVERASSDAWKARNVDRVNANRRAWYAMNIDAERETARVRQAARRAGELGFTEDDVQLIWELQDGLCFYCGNETNGRFENADHFVPIASGGSNQRWNIVMTCRRCNCRKGAKSPIEFMGFGALKYPPLWDERT